MALTSSPSCRLGISNASDGAVIGRVFVTSPWHVIYTYPCSLYRFYGLQSVTVPLNHWSTCWGTLPVVLEIWYFKNPLYGTETALTTTLDSSRNLRNTSETSPGNRNSLTYTKTSQVACARLSSLFQHISRPETASRMVASPKRTESPLSSAL